jgi:hypothetical protein
LRVSLTYSLAICFAPSLADSFIFLTLTRLVVVFIFVNFSFALFTPPLGDFHNPLMEARRRQQGLDSPDSCPSVRHQRSSDGHDIARTGCQNLSGCHDDMYLGH